MIWLQKQKNFLLRFGLSLFLIGFFVFGGNRSAVADAYDLEKLHWVHERESVYPYSLHEYREREWVRNREFFHLGEDLFEQFVRFIFPTNGREQRPEFMPLSAWGQKKPQYKKFLWQEYESNHFRFYSYPGGEETLQYVMRFMEEEYEANNELFKVQNRFRKKIPVIFYQTRRDFEQTNIIGGPIPEGLGGVTEIFSWKRAVFPFQGNFQELEHVVKHEATHIYQIEKGARFFPLWFIEGTAEANSIGWDAHAEMIIRDAYVNGFFQSIEDLWQIQGTWLMYKQGNYIVNLILSEFGREGLSRIYDNPSTFSFNRTLKDALGIDESELNDKVFASLSEDYGHLLKRKDLSDEGKALANGEVLLASHGDLYLSGGSLGPRNVLWINKIAPDGRKVRRKIVSDRRFQNESLDHFRKGASLSDRQILYVIKRSERDVVRVVPYAFNENKNKIHLNSEKEYSWKEFETISDPAIVDESRFVFVGYKNGFSNLYLFDQKTQKTTTLTSSNRHISGVDYSKEKNEVVFSMEESPLPDGIRYDRNLYLLNLESRVLRRLTNTRATIEEQPRFSEDGQRILYVADPDQTFDLMIYDFSIEESRRLTRMRIGARRPHWFGSEMLLFNAYERLSPRVYLANLPTEKDRLELDLPDQTLLRGNLSDEGVLLGRTEEVHAKTKAWMEKEAQKRQTQEIGNDKVDSLSALFRMESPKRKVLRVAPFADSVFIEAIPGDQADGLESSLNWEDAYAWSGHAVERLREQKVADEKLDIQEREVLQEKLQGRPIIRSFRDASHSRLLLLVNNRLANKSDDFKEEPDTELVLIDTGSVETLDGGISKDLLQRYRGEIQWVVFLADQEILFAVGESRTGPFDLYRYSKRLKILDSIDSGVQRFEVSPDGRHIAWSAGGAIFHFTIGSRKQKIDVEPSQSEFPNIFRFSKENQLLILGVRDEGVHLHEYRNGSLVSKGSLQRKKDQLILGAILDVSQGQVVLAMQEKKKKNSFEVYSGDFSQSTKVKIGTFEGEYNRMDFMGSYLVLQKSSNYLGKNEIWVKSEKKWSELVEVEEIKDGPNGALIFETAKELWIHEGNEKRNWKIDEQTAGSAVDENSVIYSGIGFGRFQLFRYERKTKSSAPITAAHEHQIHPNLAKDQLIWTSQEGNHWKIHVSNLTDFVPLEKVGDEEFSFLRPESKDEVVEVEVSKSPSASIDRLGEREDRGQPLLVPGRPSPNPFKLQSLTGAVAFDGDEFRFLISGFMDNLFSDQGIFVNALFFGETQYGTLGYANLRDGRNYALTYNRRDEIRAMGFEIQQNFTLDRYREITASGLGRIQQYGSATLSTQNIIEPDMEDKTFYFVGGALQYGQDVTVRDLHGPISGHRLFLRSESTMDLEEQRLGNIDANLDFRLYQRLASRFGLAHRLVGGTSQGHFPTVFLLGGNISFRGVGLDDLEGQNYWVYSGDLRVPVFDFIGAKFFDPVDRFLGIFTRYFDLRSGIYGDVGSVWFNGTSADVIYSSGYFINVPTLFGFIFRFSQGFAGRKGFNFWLGYNW